MSFILTFIGVVLGSILLGIAIFLGVARYVLGTPSRGSSGWLVKLRSNQKLNERLPLIIGLGFLLLFWGPIANLLAGFLASSDMGATLGLEVELVRSLLWVPFLALAVAIIGNTIGMKRLSNMTEAVVVVLIMLGVSFIVYASFFEGLGMHRANCELNEAGVGLTNRVEMTRHAVKTIGVCPGETAVFLTTNNRPPEVRFGDLNPGQREAFADVGVTPYWFVTVDSIGGNMYRVSAVDVAFGNYDLSSLQLVFTEAR